MHPAIMYNSAKQSIVNQISINQNAASEFMNIFHPLINSHGNAINKGAHYSNRSGQNCFTFLNLNFQLSDLVLPSFLYSLKIGLMSVFRCSLW